jgi:Secretion system C-terminal sorting domain
MKHLLQISLYTIILLISFFIPELHAQCPNNLLSNPSFENPTQNNIGDNVQSGSSFGPWVAASGFYFNIPRVNGTPYIAGPDIAQDGVQYADITDGNSDLVQSFTIACPTTVFFGGYFSRRDVQNPGFISFIDISDVNGNFITRSTILTFLMTDSQEDWRYSGGAVYLTAGTYNFAAYLHNNANFDNAVVCTADNCFLPVKLVSVKGAVKNCATQLEWLVTAEENFKHYEIEYGTDGYYFKTIGTIAGTNKSTPTNYFFNHQNAVYGKGYYRLKMVDLDGSFEFSKIISIDNNCEKEVVKIYPTIVEQFLNIDLSKSSFFKTKAILYNELGIAVKSTTLAVGHNTMDISKLAKGIYFLQVENGFYSKPVKIIK